MERDDVRGAQHVEALGHREGGQRSRLPSAGGSQTLAGVTDGLQRFGPPGASLGLVRRLQKVSSDSPCEAALDGKERRLLDLWFMP